MTGKSNKRKYSLLAFLVLAMTYNSFAQDNKKFNEMSVVSSKVNQANIKPFIYRGQSVFLIDTLIDYYSIVLPEPIADGRYVAFHDKDTSKIAFDYEFKNGKRNGHALIFYKSGQINYQTNYNEGELNGIQYFYFENGQPSIICSFVDGRPDGKYEFWYSNGRKSSEDEYENGKLVYSKQWDKNGNLVHDGVFKNPYDK